MEEPGDSVASYSEIMEAAKVNRELLLNQISLYNPDIIIFGGTLEFIKDYFNDTIYQEHKVTDINNYYISDNKLYIKTCHPAYIRRGDKKYTMDIVEIYREWVANRS